MNNQRYDKLIQKYLKGIATREEKDELLDYVLKTLNEVLVALKEVKLVKVVEDD